MALFKINRGRATNLPTNKHDGYAYFTIDDGKFYIDYENDQKVLQRQAINAEKADMDSVGNNINETYVMADSSDAEPGVDYTPDDVVNADTLGGYAANEFVLKTNMNQIIEENISWLVGDTEEITPTQVYQALLNNQNVMITYKNSPYGWLTFTNFGVVGGLDSVVATEVFQINGEMNQCQLVGNITYNVWQFDELYLPDVFASNTDVETLRQQILDLTYPIGSIYIATNSTSPASRFGGTWTRIQDRFLLAAGTSYTAGSTGGAATHALTVNEIPSHYHNIYQQNSAGGTSLGLWDTYIKSNYQIFDQKYDSSQSIKAYSYGTTSVGGGAAHNNMPPYLTVYVWKRTA